MQNNQVQSTNWILLFGQLLAQLSDRMLSIGLIWIISKNFGAQTVTWYLVVGGIPHILFFAWSAGLINKFGALKVVIGADWIRALIYFTASFILTSIDVRSELYQVMGLIFLTNVMAAFFNPAIFSLPIELATGSEVQKLTARISAIASITSVLGPIVGIFCFQSLGLRGLFLSAAIFYGLSGLCAVTIRKNIIHVEAESPTLKSLQRIPALITAMLIVFFAMNLLTSPIQILMPSMAQNIFSGDFNSLAALEMSLGGGITLGGLALSFFAIQSKTLFAVWLFLIGVSLSFFTFQFSVNILMAAAMLLLLGLFVGLANVLILNIFQSEPRPEQVPKVMSYVNIISSATVPLSLVLAGILQTQFSIYQIGRACAEVLIVICAGSYFAFRRWGQEHFQ